MVFVARGICVLVATDSGDTSLSAMRTICQQAPQRRMSNVVIITRLQSALETIT